MLVLFLVSSEARKNREDGYMYTIRVAGNSRTRFIWVRSCTLFCVVAKMSRQISPFVLRSSPVVTIHGTENSLREQLHLTLLTFAGLKT
jgi:hypothetical protein